MVLVKHSQGMEAIVARRPLSGKPCARQMGNLTIRTRQFDPKRAMPSSNVFRMTQNIVINAVKTFLKHIAMMYTYSDATLS